MADSASRARVFIQFFCLRLRLYFRPLLSNVNSSMVNAITRGKKYRCFQAVLSESIRVSEVSFL